MNRVRQKQRLTYKYTIDFDDSQMEFVEGLKKLISEFYKKQHSEAIKRGIEAAKQRKENKQ